MQRLRHGLLLIPFLVAWAGADPNPQPAAVSVDFAGAKVAGNDVILGEPVEWIRDVKQAAGRFDGALRAWVASDDLAFGQGRLVARLYRQKLPADLALTLVYEETPGTDFVVQLLDDEDRIVALDLFSNIITAGRDAHTDTFIIPFAQYPSATQVALRRLKGEVRIYGFVLSPVACEIPAAVCDERELALQLGDRLSPDSSLVREANRIVAAQQKQLDWGSHEVQSPVPLSEINAIGQTALSDRDYPAFVPSAGSIVGQVIFAAAGTAQEFVHPCIRQLNLYHSGALGDMPFISSAGVRTYLLESGAPVGIMSIPLSVADREKFYRDNGYHLIETPVALDAIQVVVNAENPLREITFPQLDAIYSTTLLAGATGFIRKWGDIGLDGSWAGRAIVLSGGDPTYGTTKIFRQLVLQGGEYRDDIEVTDVAYARGVQTKVATNRYAMGYASLRPLIPGAKCLAVARNSGQTAHLPVAGAVYGGRYPLTRYFYLYVNAKSPDRVDPVVREFLNLLFSLEGQTIVAKSGSLPLAVKQVRDARRLLGL